MLEINLAHSERQDGPGIPYLNLVNQELLRIKRQGAKVYRTHEKGGAMSSKSHVFITTSKDVHLFFGTMSSSGQHDLACLLEEKFAEHKCNQLLLYYDDKKSVLVTATTDNGYSAFNFASAH